MKFKVKRKLFILVLFGFMFVFSSFVQAGSLFNKLKGRIVLQVEDVGQAWYIEPGIGSRISLGSPDEAFQVMREMGVGITNVDISKIPLAEVNLGGADTDSDGLSDMIEDAFGTSNNSFDTDDDGFSDKHEVLNGYNPLGSGNINIDNEFATNNYGKIFLQVEQNGEAWYVNPLDGKRYFLGRAQDAFNVMRELGLGITNEDLLKIDIYNNESDVVVKINEEVLLDVPFTPQAPFGNWDDSRQQDGCEEASVVMAMHWVNNKALSKAEAVAEIIAISDFELEKYGSYKDTSAHDTVERIFKAYYSYHKVEVKEDVSVQSIKDALNSDKLVIIPANGRKLGNPYFTAPGPVTHMLVIRGYSPSTKEFITNEPGTRHGELYYYNEDVLVNAVRNYYTGDHLEISEEKKAMIIVSK